MVALRELVAFCDQMLQPAAFDDYCPNGLQVEGRAEVRRIVSGVTACQSLIDAAIAEQADLVLVHHGYFWRGEPSPLVGMKRRRLAALLGADVSLLAYHLPLDAHPEVGNNRQLGEVLGLLPAAPVDGRVWAHDLARPLAARVLADRVGEALGRVPLLVGPDQTVHRVAWCTGGAQGYIEQAAAAGCDAFISGEISEPTVHQAREMGIAYLSAGHHATERYGVQALGQRIVEVFDVEHRFIDIDNPV